MTSGSPVLDLITMIERPNEVHSLVDARGTNRSYTLLLQPNQGPFLSVCAVDMLGTRIGWVNVADVVLQSIVDHEDAIDFFIDELLDALEQSVQRGTSIDVTRRQQ